MTKRWMAEISYRDKQEPLIEQFEELYELHTSSKSGPDWNDIEEIVVSAPLRRHTRPLPAQSSLKKSN